MAFWETMTTNLPPAQMPGNLMNGEAKWFAIQTRPRHEKKVNVQLQAKGVEGFLPLLTEKRKWSDRCKVVQQPLFSCYMFVHISESDGARLSVLNTEGVCWFVGDRGKGLPIPDKQIQDIQTVLHGNVPFAPYPFLRVGQRVRIRGGCLDGVEGILLSRDADQTVVVSVELLRRSLAVHINGYDLEGL
jgi:transcription antitermination factor NusG